MSRSVWQRIRSHPRVVYPGLLVIILLPMATARDAGWGWWTSLMAPPLTVIAFVIVALIVGRLTRNIGKSPPPAPQEPDLLQMPGLAPYLHDQNPVDLHMTIGTVDVAVHLEDGLAGPRERFDEALAKLRERGPEIISAAREFALAQARVLRGGLDGWLEGNATPEEFADQLALKSIVLRDTDEYSIYFDSEHLGGHELEVEGSFSAGPRGVGL